MENKPQTRKKYWQIKLQAGMMYVLWPAEKVLVKDNFIKYKGPTFYTTFRQFINNFADFLRDKTGLELCSRIEGKQ